MPTVIKLRDPRHLEAALDGMHCAGCARKIETALAGEAGVVSARVNLTAKRLSVDFDGARLDGGAVMARVRALGFTAVPLAQVSAAERRTGDALMRALAVAGFAAGNVMLYSIAVWAGVVQDMGPATKSLFQAIAGAITVPAVLYAGQPFYRGAINALRHGRLSMDVPIAVALIMTCIASTVEWQRGAPHVYFDGAATLTFLLLIGRVLDHQARARARQAGEVLAALQAVTARVIEADGGMREVDAQALVPDQNVRVLAGERVPADGHVIEGRSDLDISLVTGESEPMATGPGAFVYAGTMNLSGPLTLKVAAAGPDTLISELARLMDNAAQAKTRFVAFADKAVQAYVPLVHALALATFVYWFFLGDVVWQQALINATTVLIVTCPCALGLAVPVAHVVAAGRLFQQGILLKAPDAFERLAAVDHVVFDKTGTLTLTRLEPEGAHPDPAILTPAVALARLSRHPLAQALAKAHGDLADLPLDDVIEHPGQGLAARWGGIEIRLGARAFAAQGQNTVDDGLAEIWFARADRAPWRFAFSTPLQDGALETVQRLKAMGLSVEILSGDRTRAVVRIAESLDVPCRAEAKPQDKLAYLAELARSGRRVAMIGDGLNDAPALAGAHIALSPGAGADIAQSAADVVFRGPSLIAVAEVIAAARRTERIVRENIAISLVYNLAAVPLAVMGWLTPLVAALAMSISSLTVVLNALRPKKVMTALLFLIPIALTLGLIGLVAFLWALQSGQYEDLDRAAQSILEDDAPLS